MKKKESSQSLLLVLVMITIFAGVIVSISSVTTRELEFREVEEAFLKVEYAAQSGEEAARQLLSRQIRGTVYQGDYALEFDGDNGVSGSYVEIPNVDFSIHDGVTESGYWTREQYTIEGRFTIREEDLDYIQNSSGLHIIYAVKDKNTGELVEGSVALAGGQELTNNICRFGKCCAYHLYVLAYLGSGDAGAVRGAGYYWIKAGRETGDNGQDRGSDCNIGWRFNPVDDLNIERYFAISFVDTTTPTFYFWTGNEERTNPNDFDMTAWTSKQDTQRDVSIYIGGVPTLSSPYKFFKGIIDEVRFYLHPRYCGYNPSFWVSPINDPLNHKNGLYGYDCDTSCCNVNTCPYTFCNRGFPGTPICNNVYNCGMWADSSCPWWVGYESRRPYIFSPSETYNMDQRDLKLYYQFEEGPECQNNATGCITDDSKSDSGNSGTMHDFSSNPWIPTQEPPQEPSPPTTVLYVLNSPLTNNYLYSFFIVPYGKKYSIQEGGEVQTEECSCPDSIGECCCEANYCIKTQGKPPE